MDALEKILSTALFSDKERENMRALAGSDREEDRKRVVSAAAERGAGITQLWALEDALAVTPAI